jgi:hypothetical protein
MRRARGTICRRSARPASRAVRVAGIACLVWTVAGCAPTLPPVEGGDRQTQTVLAPAHTPTPTSRALAPNATRAAEQTATRRVTRLTPTPQTPTPLTPTPRMLPGPFPGVEPGPVTGEVPEELLRAIVDDLVARLEVVAAAIDVVRAESIVWPDGSLGCPQPGFSYTQALVPGYWVVLEVGSQEYDYRAGAGAHFVLCERSLPLPASTPGGDTR